MRKIFFKSMLLLCALIVGSGVVWGDTYEQLTSIANIDESAEYVLGIDGTGFHYDGTSSWGKTALPSAQTPYKYTLKKANDGKSFTAETTISNTKYYLQVPTSNTFSMATSTGTNTDLIIGTTQVSGTNYAVANKTTTTRHLRINGTSGLRSYAGTTGTMAFFYKVIPAFTLTAESNNTSWGTVAISGNKITASPKTGYRVSTTTPYTVTSGTATVAQNNNEFTVTASAACTVRINFEAIPTYTVTFNAEGGSCDTESLTETLGDQGVTLPTANSSKSGWIFAGWAADVIASTSTRPVLYKEGTTYKPASNVTLHAVYTLTETGGGKYIRATEIDEVVNANSIVLVSNSDGYILNHSKETAQVAPIESKGEITPPSNSIFALSGNNTTGFILTGANGTMGVDPIPTSSGNKAISWTTTNNKWIVEETTNHAVNKNFVLRNANSTYVALEYYSGWKAYYATGYKSNTYTELKLYVPKTLYNSTPTADIITPDLDFTSGTNQTLYLDGTSSYADAASVTNVSQTITYSSSDPSVATVSNDGSVSAVGIGTSTITASVPVDLGVSSAKSVSYVVTVKSATTIAGIKAITNASSVVTFTADLTDAVVTYVNGSYAYVQDASGAIYASCGSSLTQGKKINGAVSGSVKAAYQIDEITAIDLSEATLTDGVIPTALDMTLAEIKSAGSAYDGILVTVNGVSVSKPNTTTTLKDGSKIDETEVSFTMYSPNSAASVNDQEKGDFTGFVSIYNGDTYRLNLYEQGQFNKTWNAPTGQPLTFASDAVELDEDTDDFDNFHGQAVNGAKGTVTYSIDSDDEGIVTSINSETGAIVLSGICGTATIKASAEATEVDEAGVTTPYIATSETYTITVQPRYTSTFSILGSEIEVRQATYGSTIDIPTPAITIGNYKFIGWSSAIVAPTDDEPNTMVTPSTTPTSDETYYAVYAHQVVGEDVNLDLYTNTGSTGTDATSGITAAGNINANNGYPSGGNCFGLTSSSNKTITLTNISLASTKSAKLTFYYKLAKSGSNYSSLTITQYNSKNETLGDATEITGSDQVYHASNDISLNANCAKITIVCTPAGNTYNTYVDNIVINITTPGVSYEDYRTSIASIILSLDENTWASYCFPTDVTIPTKDPNLKVYRAKFNSSTNELTATPISGSIKAGEGVLLKTTTEGTTPYEFTTTTGAASLGSTNDLIGTIVATPTASLKGSAQYLMALKKNENKFVRFEGVSFPANRACLAVTPENTNAPSAFRIVEEEQNATNIQNIESNDDVVKFFENGQLFIKKNGIVYDAVGRLIRK